MKGKSNHYCVTCKRWDVPLNRNVTKVNKHGFTIQYHLCRDCNNKRCRRWYKNNPEKAREIIQRSIDKYPDRQKARLKLNDAVKRGVVVKPDVCSVCNEGGRIEGHHHDYDKPLEVTWQCTSCHAEADKMLRDNATI